MKNRGIIFHEGFIKRCFIIAFFVVMMSSHHLISASESDNGTVLENDVFKVWMNQILLLKF